MTRPMSNWKRTLVHVGLVCFTAWPLAHIGLVKGWAVNPWKLAGWGMYSAPQIPAELRVFGLTPDTVGEYEVHDLPDVVEPLARGFLRSRLGLGRLVRPDALAEALLDAWPAIVGVRIEVVQPVLDPRSGIVRDGTTAYEYSRPGR